MEGYGWPVALKHLLAMRVILALESHFIASSLKTKVEPADSCEE